MASGTVVKVQADLQRPHFSSASRPLPARPQRYRIFRCVRLWKNNPAASDCRIGTVALCLRYLTWRSLAGAGSVPSRPSSLAGLCVSGGQPVCSPGARQNLQFAQQRAHPGPSPCEWDQVIDLLGLAALLDQRPDQLSGGERQRWRLPVPC